MGARSWAEFPLHMFIHMDRNSAEGVQRKWAEFGCVTFEEIHSLVVVPSFLLNGSAFTSVLYLWFILLPFLAFRNREFHKFLSCSTSGIFSFYVCFPSANPRYSYGLQGVGWDMVPKGSAELMWLGCRRKLGKIFFRLSCEAGVWCVSVWVFGLGQEQLGSWFQDISWWAHLWKLSVHMYSQLLAVPPQCHQALPEGSSSLLNMFWSSNSCQRHNTLCSKVNKCLGPWSLGQQFG